MGIQLLRYVFCHTKLYLKGLGLGPCQFGCTMAPIHVFEIGTDSTVNILTYITRTLKIKPHTDEKKKTERVKYGSLDKIIRCTTLDKREILSVPPPRTETDRHLTLSYTYIIIIRISIRSSKVQVNRPLHKQVYLYIFFQFCFVYCAHDLYTHACRSVAAGSSRSVVAACSECNKQHPCIRRFVGVELESRRVSVSGILESAYFSVSDTSLLV